MRERERQRFWAIITERGGERVETKKSWRAKKEKRRKEVRRKRRVSIQNADYFSEVESHEYMCMTLSLLYYILLFDC